jgi:hypothetical protein
MKARYYWIIEKDHTADSTAPKATNANAVGLTGPKDPVDAPPANWACHPFKMYDDDGELYYEGKLYFDPEYEDVEPEVWFFPKDDFGEPNAGCTEIHYKNKDGKFEAV